MITFMGGRMSHAIPPDLKHISLIKIILKYNFQSLNFSNERICVGNVRLFYFSKDGKLKLLHTQK